MNEAFHYAQERCIFAAEGSLRRNLFYVYFPFSWKIALASSVLGPYIARSF